MDAEKFVRAYEAMWASNRGDGLEDLWHADGVLEHPTLSRPIQGRLLPLLDRTNRTILPDLKWTLLSWASNGSLVFLEWECSGHLNGRSITWRGVDKMLLRDGKIDREVVYNNMLQLWEVLDPTMKRDALIDADQLEAEASRTTLDGDGDRDN